MPQITIISEKELRSFIQLDQSVIDCIENAFRLLATQEVVMPPILSFHIPEHNGEVDVKTAYVPGINSFAVKMSPGFFDNPRKGLPSLNGLVVQFAVDTGIVEAVMLDNGYLTDIRTAAAGAVAARCLSREDSRVAGIIGTGVQARLQLQALCLVRKIEKAILWGRNVDHAELCARESSELLGISVEAVRTIDELMSVSELVVTTTPASTPLIKASQLNAGQHITAMGSDADYKNELHPETLEKADLYVCDRLSQCSKLGELRRALETGLFPEDRLFPELGEILCGKEKGRSSPESITICDLTGTGVQDTAIASLAQERAKKNRIGKVFNS